jgi:hypothetical protein
MNPPPNLALHRWTHLQPDHSLIDRRHFPDFIDVMVRRAANIDSDHMLVVIKLRARILKDKDFASRYYDKLESELQGV